MTATPLPGLRALGLATAMALAGLLAACHTDDAAMTAAIGPDLSVAARHPIVVREGRATLDLLPGGGPHGLTDREAADVRAFAAEWHARGRGPIVVAVPHGGADDVLSRYALPAIRADLVAGGAPRGAIETVRYRADGPLHLAPVRLSFAHLEAALTRPCGQWPSGGNDLNNYNRPYANLGCDQQQNLAAMVADPEDLMRPRAEGPVYAARRQTVLDNYAQGKVTAATTPSNGQTNVSTIGSGQ
jgi:pilus assembly protein CpaD